MRDIVSPLDGIRSPFGQRRTFTPLSLFSAGEVGAWYDPSDFSTMFQDAAGTTPVTAVEQPVGLILDKSKSLALGSDVVTNGTFDADANWTKGTNWTISGGQATHSGSGDGNISQNAVVNGAWYKLTFTITAITNGSLIVRTNTGGSTVATFTTAGTKTLHFQSVGAQLGFRAEANTSPISIDNIVCLPIAGNHASQTTSTSRPVLSARVNLLTYSEQFDNGYWLKQRASISGTSSFPLGMMQGLVEDGTTNSHRILPNGVSVTAGATHTFSCYAKAGTRSAIYICVQSGTLNEYVAVVANLAAGTISATSVGSAPSTLVSSSITGVGGDAYRIEFSWTIAGRTNVFPIIGISNSYTPTFTSGGDVSYAGNSTGNVFIWGADLRPTNQTTGLPTYQRVGAATAGSSSAAGTGDYDTTGFPLYLKFDGTDDSMATGTITPGTNKAQVFAGLRKQSDAAFGMIVEGNTAGDGKLYLGNQTSGIYQFYSRGTADAYAAGVTAFPAPSSNVISGLGDISAPFATVRVNGVTRESVSSSQGTGNYAAQPLYIGSRAGSSLRFNGNLYSLIVRFGSNLDATTISNTETWVNGKTGAY